MSQNGPIDLTEGQLAIVRDLLNRYLPGATAWAYGSRVKGTARRTSDLDLVVFVDETSRSRVADLKDAFDESDLPFPVDLHVWDEIPIEFQEQISSRYVEIRA